MLLRSIQALKGQTGISPDFYSKEFFNMLIGLAFK